MQIGGQTWYVLASGKKIGGAFYSAYDVPAVGASDLDGFVRFLKAGFVPQDDDAS